MLQIIIVYNKCFFYLAHTLFSICCLASFGLHAVDFVGGPQRCQPLLFLRLRRASLTLELRAQHKAHHTTWGRTHNEPLPNPKKINRTNTKHDNNMRIYL